MKRKSFMMCRRSGLFGILAALALSLIQVNTSGAELIGLWGANGDANDTSGQENHGTLVNNATYATDGNRQAFSFDGQGDKVLLVSNPLSSLAQFTYMAWIHPARGLNNLFSRSGGDSEAFSFYIGSDGGLVWVLNDAPNFEGLTQTQGGLVTFDQWQHIALTRDGSTITVYINGEEMGSHTDLRSTNPVMTDPLQFGDWTGFGYSYSGMVDEIGLFDETLMQDEIQAIMTNGLAGGATAVEVMSWGWVKAGADERGFFQR